MEENKFVVIDEMGNEIEMEIVFTYEDEDSGKSFVFYLNPAEEEGEIFVSSYDADGKLTPVEDPEEWKKLEIILEDYAISQEENEKN